MKVSGYSFSLSGIHTTYTEKSGIMLRIEASHGHGQRSWFCDDNGVIVWRHGIIYRIYICYTGQQQ